MRKILYLTLSLSFTSCGISPAFADSLSKARGEYACRDGGGVYRYVNRSVVICNNGKTLRVPEVIKDPKYFVPKKPQPCKQT